jgi:hypothetical protein
MDHKNEFMIGHDGAPVSPVLAQVAYERGWCRHCGRHLSYIGKCPNCDAWWRTPYIMVGLPLLLVNLGIIGGVASRYGHKPAPDISVQASHTNSLLATQPVFSGGSASFTPHSNFAPSYQPTSSYSSFNTTMGGAQAPPILPDPWEVRLAELQNLRSMVWEAEGQYKQQERQYEQQERQYMRQQDASASFSVAPAKTSTTTMNPPI